MQSTAYNKQQQINQRVILAGLLSLIVRYSAFLARSVPPVCHGAIPVLPYCMASARRGVVGWRWGTWVALQSSKPRERVPYRQQVAEKLIGVQARPCPRRYNDPHQRDAIFFGLLKLARRGKFWRVGSTGFQPRRAIITARINRWRGLWTGLE